MQALRQWLARPLLWVMIFGGLAVYGIHAWLTIPVEVLPRFDFPQISVTTHDPGATAEALETRIARPLENQLLALSGLSSVRSDIGNGTVQTTVRFTRSSKAQQDLQAVRGAIDQARGSLPPHTQPYAQIMGNAINEVADYSARIPAGVDPAAVQRAARAMVEPALRALPGVQRVEIYGTGNEALWVQPNLEAMHQYGVSVTRIVKALRNRVLLSPGGYIDQGHQDALIELRDMPLSVAALERTPIPGPRGSIPLSDLARVVRASIPVHNAVRLDGRTTIALTVFKQPGASTLPVTRAVQAALDHTNPQLPKGVQWERIYSQGHMVHLIGSDLGRNLLVGGALAIAVLFWVLGAGRGIWVLALSIPLSLLLAIAALHATGHSLNLMTLGALTVAIGLLADDAIIVLEAIYHQWEKGLARWPGIRQGLRDIVSPDVSGSLTTISVFLPLLFVGGLAGLFFIPFALAMTLAILASLLVSLTLIPLGLAMVKAQPDSKRTMAARGLERLRAGNDRLFAWVSLHPRLSLAACTGLFLASVAGLALVPMHFLPLPNEGVLLESFTLPPGSSLQQTLQTVHTLTRRLRKDPAVAHTYARIGSASDTAYLEPAYAGEIQLVLKPGIGVNDLTAISQRILHESRRDGIQVTIGTPTLERLGESLSGLPQPFVIHVLGKDIGRLRSLAAKITSHLRTVSALADIFDNDGYPISQVQVRPRDEAMATYGITPAQLHAQLGPLLAGTVVASMSDGNLPLDIYVRLAQANHLSLAQLRAMPLRTHGWTPLGQLAHVELTRTPNMLRHINGARALDIMATPTTTLGRAVAAARKALSTVSMPAGYSIRFGGLYPQLVHALVGLGIAAAFAFLLMLGILVLQFDGLLVPGILLLQIPLAFTGGALALALSGVGLNATALVGLLTLVGLSLNHGIVLLFRAQRNEAGGMTVHDAVREAVHARFRPIVLTTATAVLGMLPTALGWGQGAAPEQGLAIVILGGMLWSALLTTNLIPSIYLARRSRARTSAS
ncbi:efflux RND transporter permease subunit [Oleiagrimonas sp.]|jgi:cobalt-zinc-cadmium resistance protein CzcA|uniref:efflux RND transporter permease subunit n=1 Tax=Oleiagrimonas sp. TaxID=2010330 RepID=UPI002602AC65|nr:efflux RND transporter permease subunit [Oleiagrimonas sp.]MDA3913636.1 efflux RND transporter permease subunit [Oleiagrimonas sp.]